MLEAWPLARLVELPGDGAQIRDKRGLRLGARGVIRCPQDRGWVNRRDRRHADGSRHHFAAVLGHPERRAEERLRCGGSHQDDEPRPDRIYLGLEPRPARAHLLAVRLLVQPALAAAHPAEVLDRVGHVHARAFDAGFGEPLVQETARRADKRFALDVLAVTGLLADEHQRGLAGALPEDRLRRVLPEAAPATPFGRAAQAVEIVVCGTYSSAPIFIGKRAEVSPTRHPKAPDLEAGRSGILRRPPICGTFGVQGRAFSASSARMVLQRRMW